MISPKAYNGRVGLAIFCLLTSQVKGCPFEVVVNVGSISGAVLADQVKSVDWRARNTSFAEKAAEPMVAEVFAKLATLVPSP